MWQRALVALAFILAAPTFSFATILTFDDLPGPTGGTYIPAGYGGFNWTEMAYLTALGAGYNGGRVSGTNVAFNAFARVGRVSDGLFNFDSAYLAAAWNNNLSVTVRGFLNNVEIYSKTVNGLNYSTTYGATATLVKFNFAGIDMLEFSSFGGVDADPFDNGSGRHFVMDDFTFNSPAVPEPATLTLFGLSLLGIGLRHRIRRR